MLLKWCKTVSQWGSRGWTYKKEFITNTSIKRDSYSFHDVIDHVHTAHQSCFGSAEHSLIVPSLVRFILNSQWREVRAMKMKFVKILRQKLQDIEMYKYLHRVSVGSSALARLCCEIFSVLAWHLATTLEPALLRYLNRSRTKLFSRLETCICLVFSFFNLSQVRLLNKIKSCHSADRSFTFALKTSRAVCGFKIKSTASENIQLSNSSALLPDNCPSAHNLLRSCSSVWWPTSV